MRMRFIFNYLTGFMVICFLVVIPPTGKAAASGELATELAMPNTEPVSDPDVMVPIAVIKKIALEKARSLWGEVAAGPPIPCCDETGELTVYMCPFRIGTKKFPGRAEIMEEVGDGRDMLEALKLGGLGVVSEKNTKDAAEFSTDPSSGRSLEKNERHAWDGAQSPKGGWVGSRKESSRRYQTALKSARKKMMGIGTYGTVYVSARLDQYPIRLCSHYLSPYYFTGLQAREKARTGMARTNKGGISGEPKLARYYFLGRRGQYFEFETDQETMKVNAHSLEVTTIMPPVKRTAVTEEKKKDMMAEWDKIAGSELIGKDSEY